MKASRLYLSLRLTVNSVSVIIRRLPPRKDSEKKLEPGTSDIQQAAEKASLVIRGLQSRLRTRPSDPAEESPEELEQQLQQYFATSVPAPQRPGPLNEIRDRVVDGVAERILRHWAQGSAIESEVVERLISRVLDRLGASAH
jgi:hypothetical protein